MMQWLVCPCSPEQPFQPLDPLEPRSAKIVILEESSCTESSEASPAVSAQTEVDYFGASDPGLVSFDVVPAESLGIPLHFMLDFGWKHPSFSSTILIQHRGD